MPLLWPAATGFAPGRGAWRSPRPRRPAVVNAGYRCPRHNQDVGGVPSSEHTRGLAADIRLPGLSLQQM
ncbi:MAG TPA: D-Ala-D-Ala carboxypeptidase family metallohydrolase [Terriglobales bacterium]|nr:D-Ala-D-Ala carboxypeptidase family metallohydrolase [Terriglobales bacterium]